MAYCLLSTDTHPHVNRPYGRSKDSSSKHNFLILKYPISQSKSETNTNRKSNGLRKQSNKRRSRETYEDPWLQTSKETETRSAPDLSLLRVAFLWTTMNGTSDVANEAETSMKTAMAEIRNLTKERAMVCVVIFRRLSLLLVRCENRSAIDFLRS